MGRSLSSLYGRSGALDVARANGDSRPLCVEPSCRRFGGGRLGPLVEQGRCDKGLPLMWHVGCAPDREAAEADLATLEDGGFGS